MSLLVRFALVVNRNAGVDPPVGRPVPQARAGSPTTHIAPAVAFALVRLGEGLGAIEAFLFLPVVDASVFRNAGGVHLSNRAWVDARVAELVLIAILVVGLVVGVDEHPTGVWLDAAMSGILMIF